MKITKYVKSPVIKKSKSGGGKYTLDPNEFEIELSNSHSMLFSADVSPLLVVDCAGVPDEIFDNEDALCHRELYSGNIFSLDDIRKIDPDEIRYYKTLEDFDNDVWIKPNVKFDGMTRTITLVVSNR